MLENAQVSLSQISESGKFEINKQKRPREILSNLIHLEYIKGEPL